MMDFFDIIAGTSGGVSVSLWFAHTMLTKYEKLQTDLIGHVSKELEECSRDRRQLWNEIMSLKQERGSR